MKFLDYSRLLPASAPSISWSKLTERCALLSKYGSAVSLMMILAIREWKGNCGYRGRYSPRQTEAKCPCCPEKRDRLHFQDYALHCIQLPMLTTRWLGGPHRVPDEVGEGPRQYLRYVRWCRWAGPRSSRSHRTSLQASWTLWCFRCSSAQSTFLLLPGYAL